VEVLFFFLCKLFPFIKGETIETFVGAAFCISTMAGKEDRVANKTNILFYFEQLLPWEMLLVM
jgi:hypothetical protein